MKDLRFAFPKFAPLLAFMALAMLWLSGCLQTASDVGSKDPPNAYDAIRRADLQPRFPQATRNADTGRASAAPASYFGTPVEARRNGAACLRRPGRICVEFREYPCRDGRQSCLGRHSQRGLCHRPARARHDKSVVRASDRKERHAFRSRERAARKQFGVASGRGRLSHPSGDRRSGRIGRPPRRQRRRSKPDTA